MKSIDQELFDDNENFNDGIFLTSALIFYTTLDYIQARYNDYQFSLCFIYFTTRLWNSLSNETVLGVKQDRFKV